MSSTLALRIAAGMLVAGTALGALDALAQPVTANLPEPPPGPIESRILATPERDYAAMNRGSRVVVVGPDIGKPAEVAAPAAPATTSLPSQQAPSQSAPLATVLFPSRTADFSLVARHELDRLAKTLDRSRTVTLYASAYAEDPSDARKIALARALAVQSYLVDKGAKSRIEIGGFGPVTDGTIGERVDIVDGAAR